MKKITIISNGSRDEAYAKFDEARNKISDFRKESVGINGNLRNNNSGWTVTKIIY